MADQHTNHDYVGEKQPNSAKATPNPLLPILHAIASLRVAIVLFALSLILVFFGTLAQKHAGIERVLGQYFYCWLAWLDLNLISDFTETFFRFRFLGTPEHPVKLNVPFPGGYIIGWAMVLNLTAAHVVRFKMTWKRSGIWILHAGMVVLLAGEFVRAEMGQEDRMSIREGGKSDFLVDLNRAELVIAKATKEETAETIKVPGEILAKKKPDDRIDLPDVPFHIKVREYMVNSFQPRARNADTETPQATNGLGQAIYIQPAKEVAGTETGGRVNMPGAIIECFRNDNGESLGTYLLGVLLEESQKLKIDDQVFRLDFRLRRTYLPFTVTAEKIENDYYPGTEIARNYASTIRLQDPRTNEDRTVVIWMNHPLRYDGATFYQSSMDSSPGEMKRTGLQVVRNPGWTLPYVSCTLVAIGMLLHFGLKFNEFLKKKAAADRRAASV